MPATKGDLVRAALRKLGIASDATLTDVEPQSIEDGVNDLEMMMAEWDNNGTGIITGYAFTDQDNPPTDGDDSGLNPWEISAVYHNLAVRIAPDYGIEAPIKLISTARYGKELILKQTAYLRAVRAPYPGRMPIGTGNVLIDQYGWHFFPGYPQKP